MMLLGWFFAFIAILLLLIAALGIVRLPDTLSRQHAATKAATLSVSLFTIGLMLVAAASGWGWGWTIRLLVMLMILLGTLPLASHALAQAGLAESERISSEDLDTS